MNTLWFFLVMFFASAVVNIINERDGETMIRLVACVVLITGIEVIREIRKLKRKQK